MKFSVQGTIILTAALLASCSSERTYKEDKSLPPGVMPHMPNAPSASLDVAEIDTGIRGGIGSASLRIQDARKIQAKSAEEMMSLYSTDDITFTDPDNPDADIKAIDEAFSKASERKSSWMYSYNDALREARRSGKPILIWFHDSQFSPASKNIAKEVFNQSNFDAWAAQNMIRVRFDKSEVFVPTGRTQSEREASAKMIHYKTEYVKNMFKQFNVRSTPAVIILHADGQRITKLSGYKSGNMNDTLTQIKHNINIGQLEHQKLRQRLIPYGYRVWTGKNKTELFALLLKYDQKSGNIWLKEFDGTVSKTKFDQLAPKDREWIRQNPSPPAKR